jgi:hypothetical protein
MVNEKYVAVAYTIATKDLALKHLNSLSLDEMKQRKLLLSAVRHPLSNPELVIDGYWLIRNEPGFDQFTIKDLQWEKIGDNLFGGTLLSDSLIAAKGRLIKAKEDDQKRLDTILADLEAAKSQEMARKAEEGQTELQARVAYLLACADLIGIRYAGDLSIDRLTNVVLISKVQPPMSIEEYLETVVEPKEPEEEKFIVPDEWKLDPHSMTDNIRATCIQRKETTVRKE